MLVIHVWFVVEPGAPGVTMNAPLFEGLARQRDGARKLGAAPVPGSRRRPGDHVVEKMRMSAWEGTRLETMLKALSERDVIIVTGAWTNMSVEHTSRTGADKGYSWCAGGLLLDDECRMAQRLR